MKLFNFCVALANQVILPIKHTENFHFFKFSYPHIPITTDFSPYSARRLPIFSRILQHCSTGYVFSIKVITLKNKIIKSWNRIKEYTGKPEKKNSWKCIRIFLRKIWISKWERRMQWWHCSVINLENQIRSCWIWLSHYNLTFFVLMQRTEDPDLSGDELGEVKKRTKKLKSINRKDHKVFHKGHKVLNYRFLPLCTLCLLHPTKL